MAFFKAAAKKSWMFFNDFDITNKMAQKKTFENDQHIEWLSLEKN